MFLKASQLIESHAWKFFNVSLNWFQLQENESNRSRSGWNCQGQLVGGTH